MNRRRRNGPRAIAAFLLFSLVLIALQTGFAEQDRSPNTTATPQQFVARLTTRNNQTITVNGVNAITGATILTGATIETSSDTSATVNIGPPGSVDIEPGTKLVLTYDDERHVKALIIFGCAILTANKNTSGEIANEQGSVEKNEKEAGGVLRMCFPAGVVQNPGNGQGGLFGLGRAATIAIFSAGGAAALTPLAFQDNPSGSTP